MTYTGICLGSIVRTKFNKYGKAILSRKPEHMYYVLVRVFVCFSIRIPFHHILINWSPPRGLPFVEFCLRNCARKKFIKRKICVIKGTGVLEGLSLSKPVI